MKISAWLTPLGAALSSCAALSLCAAAEAMACDVQGPVVTIRFTGMRVEAFERAVVADLEAGLARTEVSVCPPELALERAAQRVAALELDARSPRLVELEVRLLAGGSELRLDRQVDLSQVPADSRAFAVALAADELLRASGVEWLGGGTELAGTPAAEAEPARPVTAALVDQATPAPAVAPGSWSLGMRPALERFSGGQSLWGADVAAILPLAAQLELQLAPGVRRGLPVSTAQGQIESSALSLAAHARYHLLDRGWRLSAGLGLYGARLALQGASPRAGASASRFVGLALYGQGLLSASLPLSSALRFELSGALGAPLRELEATADGRTATAASGLQLALGSALWLQL